MACKRREWGGLLWWRHSLYTLTLNHRHPASLLSPHAFPRLPFNARPLPSCIHALSPQAPVHLLPPQASAGSFVPLLTLLIGQPAVPSSGAAGSGVLGGLASKDW